MKGFIRSLHFDFVKNSVHRSASALSFKPLFSWRHHNYLKNCTSRSVSTENTTNPVKLDHLREHGFNRFAFQKLPQNKSQHMKYLCVLDVEATCNRKDIPFTRQVFTVVSLFAFVTACSEVIEVPVVLLNITTLQVEAGDLLL